MGPGRYVLWLQCVDSGWRVGVGSLDGTCGFWGVLRGDWASNVGAEETRRWPAELGDGGSQLRDVCISLSCALKRTFGLPVSLCGESGSLSVSRGYGFLSREPYSQSSMPCSVGCPNVGVPLCGISSSSFHRSFTYTSAIARASSSSTSLSRMSQLVQCQMTASFGWCWRWIGGARDLKNRKRSPAVDSALPTGEEGRDSE